MPAFLPKILLALFAPNPPIKVLPPPDAPTANKRHRSMTGVAGYLHVFEAATDPPPAPQVETKAAKKERVQREKRLQHEKDLEAEIAKWRPSENTEATRDPYKTLFVANLSYGTSRSQLKRKFERYGTIRDVAVVKDKEGQPRGYAFIEFKHSSDMRDAYKRADGMEIDGREIVVDYERGRTKSDWLPRRLGGGKGNTRLSRPKTARRRRRHRRHAKKPE